MIIPSVAGLSSAASASASGATSPYLVTFRPGAAPDLEARAARAKGWHVRQVFHRALRGMAVDLTPAAMAALSSDPTVARVDRDVAFTIDTDQTGVDWGLDRTDQRSLPLNDTYSYPTAAGAGVKVYVIDTGVRSTHTELAGRVDPGYSLIADGNGTEDCHGHGTHVAGTIAGTTYGMAKAARIVPIRVLDCLGNGSISAVVAGLDWVLAFNNGAPAVVNMSLGGGPSVPVDDAVNRVIAAGVPVVVAAGNSAFDACLQSPARVPAAITVGATQSDDARAQYSNFGSCVDLWAPGTGITSAWATSDTATNTISGTSMATPHVAGAVALLESANPGITPAAVASMLVANATPNVLTDLQPGSPNLLLYTSATPPALPLAINPVAFPSGMVNAVYSKAVTAVGGAAPYTWSVATGALPAGLSLSPTTGVVSGTPTAAGTASFTLRATDAKAVSATLAASITIAPFTNPPGAFAKSSPSNGSTGRSYTSLSFTWTAATGVARYEICIDRFNNGVCDGTWVSAGTSRTYTATNLLNVATYFWQVRAVNAGGTTMANAGTWWTFGTK